MRRGGHRLSPEEFRAHLLRRAPERIEGCTVEGEVSFAGMEIDHGLRILHVTFEGPVDFSDARVAGTLDLTGSVFERTLRLDNCKVQGDLVLDDVRVEARARLTSGRYDWEVVPTQLSAKSMEVSGVAKGDSLFVAGDLSFAGSRFLGGFELLATRSLGSLSLENCRCEGDCAIEATERARPYFATSVSLRNSKISGNLRFLGIAVGADVDIWSVEIAGNLFFRGHVEAGGKRVHPCTIVGDINMAASEIRGHLQIESAVVGGRIKIYSSRIARLILSDSELEGLPETMNIGVRAGAIDAQGVRIDNNASFRAVEVAGMIEGGSGVSFAGARIGGSLSMWSPLDSSHGHQIDPLALRTKVIGDLDLRGAEIGGHCTLTNIVVDGAILLDDAKISGDVLCQSQTSLLDDISIRENNRALIGFLKKRAESGAKPRPRASARRISMGMLRADNDLDLSGLELRATPAEIAAGEPYGSLEASNLRVAGRFYLFRETVKDRSPDSHSAASIPGAANLTGCELGALSVSWHSFLEYGDPELVGLRLDGSRIGELTIEAGAEPPAFPVPLTVADIEVRIWNIGENDANRSNRYERLLRCDPYFRRSTYLAVERSLRNRGHEDAADHIYRSMKRRAWREGDHQGKGALSRAGHRVGSALRWLFWDALLGFGTAPSRLLWVIIGLLVASFALVYDDPRNFGPTLQKEIAVGSGTTAAPDGRTPEEWSSSDAAAVAARTHIPIVALAVRDEWELSDDPDRPLYLAGRAIGGVRPEDFGMWMMLLNFVLWPPLLAFWLRRVFRQSL